MCPLCCLGGASAVVRRPGGLRPTASANRTDTANHHLHVLGLSVLTVVVEDEAEEAEVGRDLGTRTGAIVQEAIHRVAALLGDAGARAMIVEARVGARHQGGESAITVPQEVVVVVVVDGGAARATQMPATGATAVIAAVAVVGIVVDVGGSAKQMYKKDVSLEMGLETSFQ